MTQLTKHQSNIKKTAALRGEDAAALKMKPRGEGSIG
jgi:hypothetical protein